MSCSTFNLFNSVLFLLIHGHLLLNMANGAIICTELSLLNKYTLKKCFPRYSAHSLELFSLLTYKQTDK